MSFIVVIPARYASTRLPGKPLLDIAGKSMLQHVYDQARKSRAQRVVIATDDQRIFEVAEGFGAEVVMTSSDHPSGTDRLEEVVSKLALNDDAHIVNVQGDEPLITPYILEQLIAPLIENENIQATNIVHKINNPKELESPHVVKCVLSNTQKIIRDIHVPILVVKEEATLFPFKNIVFVSDFKEDMSNAFKQVVKIAEKCNSKIHLLNINTNKDFNNIKNGIVPIREFLTNFPELENYEMHVYNESTILKGIETFQKDNEVDLVAMYTHNRSGLSNIFSKSIAENITNNSKKPVMTIHL